MPTYETLFITRPNLVEDEEKSTVATLAQVVSDGGGKFTVNDRMGRRRLAYPINKFEDGVYTRFLYDSGSDVPRELERRIRLSDNVLRSLTVKLERGWAVHSKEQAVRDAARRLEEEAEAERQAVLAAEQKAAAEAAAAAAAEAGEAEAETPEATPTEPPVESSPKAETDSTEKGD